MLNVGASIWIRMDQLKVVLENLVQATTSEHRGKYYLKVLDGLMCKGCWCAVTDCLSLLRTKGVAIAKADYATAMGSRAVCLHSVFFCRNAIHLVIFMPLLK